ncbi:MAG: hypothetical protein NTW03_22205, partial [Verrucomicrobia bacterium]|nr:hypothetical protein [Verrucomicrobiota bacterium]
MMLLPLALWAGGSGLNTVVVVNQASSNSLALGNDYCERRQVPPQNLLRIHWPGGNIAWTLDQFQSTLATPLQALLAGLGPTNPIDYVVLSMDIPYRVTSSNGVNSTTSVLFYGFKADTASSDPLYPSCSLPPASSNSYAFSEGIFRATPPDTAPGRPVLAMMLTAASLASARAILEQGVASDATAPTQTVYLAKTSDVFRNVRFVLFDDAIFNARLLGDNSLMRITSDSPAG